MPIDNLNAKYWMDLQSQHPEKMGLFFRWLDKYAKDNKWSELFNYGSPSYAKMGWHHPKFFDMPIAMQAGIFAQFMAEQAEQSHATDKPKLSFFEHTAASIRRYFTEHTAA
jgi:hypothetical protein